MTEKTKKTTVAKSVTVPLTPTEYSELEKAVAAFNTGGPGVATASTFAKWAVMEAVKKANDTSLAAATAIANA